MTMNLIGQLSITAFCAWMAKDVIYAYRQGWWDIGTLLAAFVVSLMALAWWP